MFETPLTVVGRSVGLMAYSSPMQALIYTRVSRDTQEGRSVEDQERECRTECERQGWPVRAVFCDNNISASRYGNRRPEWERLKTELRQGDVLVMWEASRAARDLEEFVAIRKLCADLNVPLSYSGKVRDLTLGDDRFVAGLDALICERESEQIRVRTLRGKRAGAAAGRPAGRLPWGYRVVSPGMWELDPVEAPRIKEAVDRILAGESHTSVYHWLQTTEGYSPPSLTAMCRSLRKPTYAGKRVANGDVVGDGNWPKIITEEQHIKLVARMDRVRKAWGRYGNPGPEPKHLLSHIATCGKCGRGLPKRKNRHGTPIYVCPQWHCSRVAEPIERAVEEELFERLSKVDPKQFEDGDDPAVEQLWDEIAEVERQLEQFSEAAIAGDVTAKSFAKVEQGLNQRIQDLKAEAVQADTEQVDLADILANWADLPMRDKRAIVRGFFTVTVNPAKRGDKVGLAGVEITPL
jgi:site-specific DNA recombinase